MCCWPASSHLPFGETHSIRQRGFSNRRDLTPAASLMGVSEACGDGRTAARPDSRAPRLQPAPRRRVLGCSLFKRPSPFEALIVRATCFDAESVGEEDHSVRVVVAAPLRSLRVNAAAREVRSIPSHRGCCAACRDCESQRSQRPVRSRSAGRSFERGHPRW